MSCNPAEDPKSLSSSSPSTSISSISSNNNNTDLPISVLIPRTIIINNNNDNSNSTINNSNNNTPNDPVMAAPVPTNPPHRPRAPLNKYTVQETVDLLKLWSSPVIQNKIKHNSCAYQIISHQMCQLGYNRSITQCKARVRDLKSKFYSIKKSNQDPSGYNFPYYQLIGDVVDKEQEASTHEGVSLESSILKSETPRTYSKSVLGLPSPYDPLLSPSNDSGFPAPQVAVVKHLIHGPDTFFCLPNGFSKRIGTEGRECGGGVGRPSSTNTISSGGSGGGGGLGQIHSSLIFSETSTLVHVDGTTTSSSQAVTKNLSSGEGENDELRDDPSTSIKNASFDSGSGSDDVESLESDINDEDPSLPASILEIEILEIEDGHCMNQLVEKDDDKGGNGLVEENLEVLDGDGNKLHDEIVNLPSPVAVPASRLSKRSVSASFGQVISNLSKSSAPMKRSRGVSSNDGGGGSSSSKRHQADVSEINRKTTSTSSANGTNDDPLVSYLAEMVEYERECLVEERQRVDIERSQMMYMMELVQGLVFPSETQQVEKETEVEGKLDQQSAMNANSGDHEIDGGGLMTVTTNQNHRPKMSSHHEGGGEGGSAEERIAQLIQMFRDNEEAEDDDEEGGEGELGEEIDDDDELIEEFLQVQEEN